MTQPSQGAMFETPCELADCKRVARPGGWMCQVHWKAVPEKLRIRYALAADAMKRAKAPQAVADCRRAVDVARQACVQAVAK